MRKLRFGSVRLSQNQMALEGVLLNQKGLCGYSLCTVDRLALQTSSRGYTTAEGSKYN